MKILDLALGACFVAGIYAMATDPRIESHNEAVRSCAAQYGFTDSDLRNMDAAVMSSRIRAMAGYAEHGTSADCPRLLSVEREFRQRAR